MIGWTPAAQAIIDTAQDAWFCDLYSISLLDGTLFNWTGADTDVLAGDVLFTRGPLIERERIALRAGLETDKLTLRIYPAATDMAAGVPLAKALLSGLFDGAAVSCWRGIAASAGAEVVGAVPRFTKGKISMTSGNGFEVRVEAVSALWRLGQPFPRSVYSPSCRHQLFDGMCKLNRESFGVTASVVGSTSDRMSVSCTATVQPENYFRFGVAEFLTGANAGRVLRIKSSLVGDLRFAQPWGGAIAYGDEIRVYPGCDKTLSTCEVKFSNRAQFGGTPFVPAAELSV